MLHANHPQSGDVADAVSVAGERGTEGADRLKGHRGNDNFNGRGGDDVLLGRDGDDRLNGGAGADVVKGGHGRDYVVGGTGDDVVRGGLGNDHLRGGDGDDILRGGFGKDHLTGGAGADQFRVAGDGKLDIVTDFNALEGDRINAVGFQLLGLKVDVGLGITTATFDRNHDGIADASIRVKGLLDVASIIFGRQPPHAVVPEHAFAGHDQAAGTMASLDSHHHVPLIDTAHLAIA